MRIEKHAAAVFDRLDGKMGSLRATNQSRNVNLPLPILMFYFNMLGRNQNQATATHRDVADAPARHRKIAASQPVLYCRPMPLELPPENTAENYPGKILL